MRTKPFVCLALLLATVIFLTPAIAQSIFGTILGTVTDPSGAVVAGVIVTVTNQGDNSCRPVKTDDHGDYRAENMKAGIYTVTVKAQGFKEAVLTDIRLDARQTVREDFGLTMGQTQEKVTVEANAELVTTESQTISASIGSTEVLNLPANYRGNGSTSVYNLIAFLPGVTGDGGGNISVQGTGINQTEYSIDGISTTNIRGNDAPREVFPSAESISELKVQGSGGGAEYGNPADITTTSKSGTNVFHGSAFEYLQNAALDAKQFSIFTVGKAAKSANTFGGSIGGPLFGKRTFFFGDYEGMRFRTSQLRTATVPNQAMRNGDFSAFLGGQESDCGDTGDQPCFDALGRPIFLGEVYDPDTTRIVSGQSVRDGFGFDPVTGLPISGQANIIPSSRFDPRAAPFLQFYPLPNQGGPDNFASRNWAVTTPNPTLSDQFDIRIDHTLNAKQNLFGRWTYKNIRQVFPSDLILPSETDYTHINQIVLAHNYAITQHLINELRGGISRRLSDGTFPLDGLAFMQQLALNSSQLGPFPQGGFPRVIFEPRGGIDEIVHTRPNHELSQNFQINENLTWTRGKHTMKFGFDIRRLHMTTTWYSGSSSADDYGDFFFNGQYSGSNVGDSCWEFLTTPTSHTRHRAISMATPPIITCTLRIRSGPHRNSQ